MKDASALKAALVLVSGIVFGRYLMVPASVLWGAAGALLFLSSLAIMLIPDSRTGRILVVVSLFWLGCFRYQVCTVHFPVDHIIHHTGYEQDVIVRGFLDKDPDIRSDHIAYQIECRAVAAGDKILPVSGKIRLSVYRKAPDDLKYGDEVMVKGRLTKPRGSRNPGGFDYRAYLAGQSVYGILKPAPGISLVKTGRNRGNPFLRFLVYPVRRSIQFSINQMIHGESQALMKALLTGDRSGLTPDLRDDFSKAGVIHVLAVSGLHAGFVCLILLTLFSLFRFPYLVRIALTITGLILFALITEAKAPVVRASFMASLFLIGTLFERKANPVNMIGFSLLVMLLFKPGDLFQIGFQLSFGAVASIVYFYSSISSSRFYRWFQKQLKFRFLKNNILPMMLVSFSAQLGTLPLTAVYFNRVPLLSIPANLIAVPLTGLIVALGLTAVIIAPISHFIARPYMSCAQLLLSLFVWLFRWLGRLSWSHISVPSPGWIAIGIYGTVLLLVVHGSRRRVRKYLIFALLILLNVAVWERVVRPAFNKLVWIQFDVGQGDAALLRMPHGKNMLIDGGARQEGFDQGEKVIAPYLRRNGIRSLDAVVLTHPHNDHVGGLIYIMNHFNVKQIYTAGTVFYSGLYGRFFETIEQKRIPHQIITAPDSILFPGVRLYFLSPSETLMAQTTGTNSVINNQSLVIRLLYGKNILLFTGDAEKEAEYDMLSRGRLGPCDAVKSGHHGSSTSSSFPFVRRIAPKFAVISVGENNRHGHPSDEVIQRYADNGALVLRTDEEGAIVFRLDGEKVERVIWK